MGWLWLALLGAASLTLMARLGVPRVLWSLVGAALMLAAAGYALQGSPTLAGQPARPELAIAAPEPELAALRDAMFGRFTTDFAYMVAADAMNAAGEKRAAVRAVLGGLSRIPRSVELWTGLGTALATHDGDQLSPPALFAFNQAIRLAPKHPAPPFFLGVAYVRAGEFDRARPYWARALALAPPRVSYRRDIALRLALLDRYLVLQEREASAAR